MLPSHIKRLLQLLKQYVKQVDPEDCDRVLEALAVASIIATLWTCSGVAGIFSTPVAIYCLINKHRGRRK